MTEQCVDTLTNEWLTVCGNLEKELGDRLALRWLKRIIPNGIENNQVCLCVPSPCIHELVKQNYAEHILTLWQRENPTVDGLQFKLSPPKALPQTQTAVLPPVQTPALTKPIPQKAISHILPEKQEITVEIDGESIPCFLDATHTFENFVVGKSNEFAYAAARRVAEDETVSFNPLYIHASVGLGKTHLMHAIAWRIKELYPDKTVLYLSSEQFFQHFIKSLRHNNTDSFRNLFRTVDVLMIDDVQFIFGKKATQEEFFHTFNTLISRGKKIILSADSNPLDLQGIEERLKTRIAQGLVVNIQPTSYDLRLGILQEKVKTLPVHIPGDILDFLAHNITASVRELEGALKRLVAHAQLIGTPINVDTTKMVLKDVLQETEKTFQVSEIQAATAAYFELTLADIKSTRRDRKIARPRQIAMFLAKQLTPFSLPDIGKAFGRDHTTVMHAIKTIEGQLKRDPQMVQDKNNILTLLKEGNYGTHFF